MSQRRRWRRCVISAIHQGMSTASRPTLFASLRRDRLLFALLGSLLLLFHALQPLAAAQMPDDRHFAICTIHGIDNAGASDKTPAGPFDDCPVCLISAACSGLAVHKAMLDASAAFPTPAMVIVAQPRVALRSGPDGRQGEPSPAIRAPPFSA